MKTIQIHLTQEQYDSILLKINEVCIDQTDNEMVEGWEEKSFNIIGENVKSDLLNGDLIFDIWNNDEFSDIVTDFEEEDE